MSESKPLGREAILASKSSRKSQVIEVAELGSVRVMVPDTRGSLFIHNHKDGADAIGAVFVATVVDEQGKRIFDLTDEAISEVMELPGEIVLAVANGLVGLRQQTVTEEIKNSPASPISASPTV